MNIPVRSILSQLVVQIGLTLFSCTHWSCLLICSLFYIVVLVRENPHGEVFHHHYTASLIFTLAHFLVFTLSYAEILPWEIVLVVLFFALVVFYLRKLSQFTCRSPFHSILFERNGKDVDDSVRYVLLKCYFSQICYYFYTFHLCLTTICTPEMYFNWFLIITNCRYTYLRLFSSYTFSGGILISLTWAMISLIGLIRSRVMF